MEPATKRRKTAGALAATDEDDELFLEPEELNLRRDPAFQLAKGRARAATQLKNRFEDIFAKYEKDFTGIGDEIDLATGEVVVDNGHLSSMRSMEDWIVDDDEDEEDEEPGGEEEQLLTRDIDGKRISPANGTPKDPWRIAAPSWPSESESREPPSMGSLLPTQLSLSNSSRSFPPFARESLVSADPNWCAPELPASALLSRRPAPTGRHYGGTSPVVTRTVLKKSVPAPGSPEADEEDDLQTASSNALERQATGESQRTGESPLINKFPTVDSSPQDNGLHDLIQDVIENIPDTPPSIRRLRLPKSQGKPSPLNQEHRLPSKTNTKLRLSETPNSGNGQKAHIKRGRKRLSPGKGKQARSTSSDQLLWDESDLETFLDVTSQGITKPPGQILHIDIRASSSIRGDQAPAENISGSHTRDTDAEDEDSTFHEDLPGKSMAQDSEAMHVGIMNLDPRDPKPSITAELGQQRELDKAPSRDKFERNVVDPAFIFSDEETLLPKRSKQKRRQSEPVRPPIASLATPREPKASRRKIADEHGQPAAESPMLVDSAAMDVQMRECGQDIFVRNTVDQSFVFSDEEKSLPRRRKQNGGNSDPVLAKEAASLPMNAPPITFASSEQLTMGFETTKCAAESVKQRRPSVGVSSTPDLASEIIAAQGKTPVSRKGTEQSPPTNGDWIIDLGQRDSPSLEQGKDHPVAEADFGVSKSSKKSTIRLATDQSGTQEERAVAVDTRTAGGTIRTRTSRTHSRTSSQRQSPAVPASCSPEKPQSGPPATPRRPRLKRDEGKTPSSVGTNLISLLSDSDDDEDEISFNLSDFTPSGHHRILVHRPLTQSFTTSRLSTSSANKKKRASLLHSRSHSARSHRTFKTPRTPHSAGSDGAGDASHKQSRRRHHQLARSVVQVVHRRDSDDDREGSVVQTPGGSKRRCGVEGWKCERDFCFVCMC